MAAGYPDNAWRVDWFLGIGRNAEDAGIETASFSMLGIAANALAESQSPAFSRL